MSAASTVPGSCGFCCKTLNYYFFFAGLVGFTVNVWDIDPPLNVAVMVTGVATETALVLIVKRNSYQIRRNGNRSRNRNRRVVGTQLNYRATGW